MHLNGMVHSLTCISSCHTSNNTDIWLKGKNYIIFYSLEQNILNQFRKYPFISIVTGTFISLGNTYSLTQKMK